MFKESIEDNMPEFVLLMCLSALIFVGLVPMYGAALIQYPIIVGGFTFSILIFTVFVWSLKNYFEIKKQKYKPSSKEIINKKYAEGELTEEELEKELDIILQD